MNTMKGKRLCLQFDGKQVKQIEDYLYCHYGKDCYQCHITWPGRCRWHSTWSCSGSVFQRLWSSWCYTESARVLWHCRSDLCCVLGHHQFLNLCILWSNCVALHKILNTPLLRSCRWSSAFGKRVLTLEYKKLCELFVRSRCSRFSVSSAWPLPWSKVLWLLLNKCFFNVADKKVDWLNILFLIHGWCLVYSYTEDDAEYLQDQNWGGEDDVGDSSSLHLQLLCSIGSQLLHGCQALSNDLSAIKSAFHIKDHYQRLGQLHTAPFLKFVWTSSVVGFCWWWHRAGAKVKYFGKTSWLWSSWPIQNRETWPSCCFMSTELSDLVVYRAGSFWKWQMLSKVEVEKWKREAYQSFDTFKHFVKKITCVCQWLPECDNRLI